MVYVVNMIIAGWWTWEIDLEREACYSVWDEGSKKLRSWDTSCLLEKKPFLSPKENMF